MGQEPSSERTLRARAAAVCLLLGLLLTVLSLILAGVSSATLALALAGTAAAAAGAVAQWRARRALEQRLEHGSERLAEAEERYRRLVEEIPLVTYVDALHDRTTLYISPQIESLLGYGVEQWLTDPDLWLRVLHPEDRERVCAEELHHHVTGEPLDTEYRVIAADGREVWFHDAAVIERAPDGTPVFSRGYRQDITERKTLETRLADAFHDPITGLPNRALFFDRVENSVLRHRRPGRPGLAVLFLDLDDFKTVNDSLGHPGGDAVLTQVGARIRSCLRPGDTAARLGGDEFAVLVEDCPDPGTATSISRRLSDAFKEPFVVGEREVFVSVSLGIAYRVDGESAEELLRNADVAMYRAKGRGKGRIDTYEPSMRLQALERLELSTELQRAMQRDELELEFQPIVALGSGELAGTEALVRWRHPVRGSVTSSDFIALAEETGLIVPLGRFVLERACRSAAAWAGNGGRSRPFVSVNLSLRELQEDDLVEAVQAILLGSGLHATRLVLEITETTLMVERDEIVPRLQALGRLGVRLAVDDFGTGYSSLNYLNELPVDIIKIAKPFVDVLGHGSDDRLARAIIGLGSALGLSAVAEGVETERQVQRLRALRCDFGQGFYFARPTAEGDVAALLDRHALRVA